MHMENLVSTISLHISLSLSSLSLSLSLLPPLSLLSLLSVCLSLSLSLSFCLSLSLSLPLSPSSIFVINSLSFDNADDSMASVYLERIRFTLFAATGAQPRSLTSRLFINSCQHC